MFGTFNLFNFFQQPNTGIIPAPGTYTAPDVINGTGRAGTIADFNWEFPYGGTQVPPEIVQGGGGDFILRLFSDSDVGIRFATVTTTISGSIDGQKDFASTSMGFSGSFVPKDSDSSSSYLLFSGLISGEQPQSGRASIVIRGAFLNSVPDYNYPFVLISGSVNTCKPDAPTITNILSGQFTQGNTSAPTAIVTLSGKFIPVYSDKCNISYGFYSFSTDTNKIIADMEFDDQCNLSYGFAGFTTAS